MGIRDRIAKVLLPPGTSTMTEQQVMGAVPQSGMRAEPLPRDENLGNIPFPPAMPLIPALINQPRADGRADPRRYEFPVAWNLQISEQRAVPFRVLRDVADYDIIRKCVEVAKAAIIGQDWDIAVSKSAIGRIMDEQQVGSTRAAKIARDGLQEDIVRAKDFWRSPDRINGLSFQEWLALLLEEVLVIDALSIYPNKTYDASLHSLEILDGATIKPLLDARGARPAPPNVAFQQLLWGFPRGEFAASPDAAGDFTADDLVYAPRVRRPFTPYGFSPVERALPLVDLHMKRMQWFRTEFTDGTLPDAYVKSDAQFGNNPELLRGYEQVLNDALAGNMEQRRRHRLLPNGMEPVFPPDNGNKWDTLFDEYLIKCICGHFGVLPTQIGFTPQSGLGGSGHQQGEANSAETLGMRPLATWTIELLNMLMQKFLGVSRDLTFVFSDGTEDDEMAMAQRRQVELFTGQKTWNEVRSEMGMGLFDFPEADSPLIVAGAGVMPLSATFESVQVSAVDQDNEAQDAPTSENLIAESLTEEQKAELATFIKYAKHERARPFTFAHVDSESANTLNALVASDAAAARDLAALWKAGDARPKVRTSPREPFPASHPARRMSDKLVPIYTERFASLGNVRATEVAQRWLDAPTDDARRWLTARYPQVLNLQRGEQVLRDLYAESGWMGYASAKALMRRARNKAISSGVDWGNWTPGNPEAALALLGEDGRGAGLQRMLDRAGITIQSINETRLDQLAMLLAVGVDQGMPVREVAELIESTLTNASRAEMIAHTEMTRATNEAANDRYRQDGVSQVAWETADDNACEECAAHEENGPYGLDDAPQPPEHPWCGCMLVPVEFDNELQLEYTAEEEAEMAQIEEQNAFEDVLAQVSEQFDNLTVETPDEHANVDEQPSASTEAEVVEQAQEAEAVVAEEQAAESAESAPADPTGYKPGEWVEVDLDAKKQEMVDEYRAKKQAELLPQGGTPEQMQGLEQLVDYYAKRVDQMYEKVRSEWTNGDVTVRDMYGLKPQQMQQALADIDLARQTRGVPDKTLVELKNNRDFAAGFNGNTTGVAGYAEMAQSANNGLPKVTLRGEYYKTNLTIAEQMKVDIKSAIDKAFAKTHAEGIREIMAAKAYDKWIAEQATNPGWTNGVDTRMALHTTVHEFGHATDLYKIDAHAKVLSDQLFAAYKDQFPAAYGRTKAVEAYAEAFANWVVTRGATTNSVVQAYANAYGWRKP